MHMSGSKRGFSDNRWYILGNTLNFARWSGVLMAFFMTINLVACVSPSGPSVPSSQKGDDGITVAQPEPAKPLTTTPFEQGGIVAYGQTTYRKFIDVSDTGGYVVQDFYAGTEQPRTNPYVMTRLEEVDALLFEETGQLVQDYRHLTEMGIGIDGPYVQWYRSGGKAIEGLFDRNFPIGPWVLTYENGHPMLQDTWSNGMRNGVSKGWHENGSLAGEGEYINNMRQGVWIVWYPNGAKMQEGFYNQGQQDGEWTFWFENGSKKEAGSYINGVRFGMWRWWTRDGVLAREAEYDEMGNVKGTAVGSGRIQPRDPVVY